MTQPTPARVRICGDCDGFPVVAIDTGTRHVDGTRVTLMVACRGCKGAGTVPLNFRSLLLSSNQGGAA